MSGAVGARATVHQLDRALVRSLVTAVTDRGAKRPGHGAASDDAASSGDTDSSGDARSSGSIAASAERELSEESVGQIFATAAWSAIVEPGDAVAGVVVGALGADRALSMLLEARPSADWLAACTEADGSTELRESDFGVALERWRPRLASRLVVSALRSAAHCSVRFITPVDSSWPASLQVLGAHAPIGLWVRGDVRSLSRPGGSIAIVGSRDATNYGEHMAMDLASGLSDRGFGIVSGAAYGIDGMAHRAALASRGTTVAFLAGGVDRLYPAAHHDLLLRVAASGAIVSELPCGSSPTKWRFLQRNRLIAALSLATVVVEAGYRSGSLNTAGHAAALGRPLGAVPGPVTSVTSAGCHRLLREYDAVCITSAGDVVELALGSADADVVPGRDVSSGARDADATRVLDALSRRSPRPVTDIAQRAGMAARMVAATLGALALEGAAIENENGWLRL